MAFGQETHVFSHTWWGYIQSRKLIKEIDPLSRRYPGPLAKSYTVIETPRWRDDCLQRVASTPAAKLSSQEYVK